MTRIVTDTTCALPFPMTRQLEIPMIPQIINIGDQSYREGIDLDFAGFMGRLSERPKTAAPYVGDFDAVFRDLVTCGESIICLHPSLEVSGTVRSATVAKEAYPDGDIRVVDTRTVAGPLGVLVLEANHLARNGAGPDEVEAFVREMAPRARIYFMVDDLEFLRRGGRIGGAAALVGSVLQIKPILTFRNGQVDQFEKERTKRRALARLKELVQTEAAPGNAAHLTVMHTGGQAQQEAQELAAELIAAHGLEGAMVLEMVPAIITHAGPGVLAVGFFAPA